MDTKTKQLERDLADAKLQYAQAIKALTTPSVGKPTARAFSNLNDAMGKLGEVRRALYYTTGRYYK